MSDETGETLETGNEDKTASMNDRQQQIVDMGSATIKTERGTIHTLTIVGQIEGHQILPPTLKSTKYEHVMPLLATIEESEEVDGLLVLLNTVGGDIEAGLGIAELISSMSKPTVSLVLGGRALHRRAPGGVRQDVLRRAVGGHDHPSCAAERAGHRRAPDIQLL